MLSISTCWNGHRHNEDGMHMVYEAILLGFNSMEPGYDLAPVLTQGFHDVHAHHVRCKSTRMNFTGVNNVWPKPENDTDTHEFTSQHSQHRKRAIELAKKSIDLAADLGGDYVVISLGSSPMTEYTPRLVEMVNEGQLYSKPYAALKLEMIQERESLDNAHLDRVREALDELIPYAQKKGIRLGLESGAHYEQVANEDEMETLLAEYDTPVIGYWHDFGHIQLKANLGLLNHRQWLEKMQTRLIGCHVHDVIWPAKNHSIPFQGDVDFDQLMPLVPNNVPMVWEINPRCKSDDIKAALINWKEKYGD